MKEFEYSFVVDSAEAFHAYCLTIHPLEVGIASLRRRVYKDNSSTIARITEETTDDDVRNFLDFKTESPDNQLVKHVEETPELAIAEDKLPYVSKLLGALDYELSVDMVKKRTRYTYDGVHVDIDEYSMPYEAVVIEIEGDPAKTENLYAAMQKHLPGRMDP